MLRLIIVIIVYVDTIIINFKILLGIHCYYYYYLYFDYYYRVAKKPGILEKPGI